MPENQNVEWKETWKDEYLKWVCGFANARGGKIFIGKNDNGVTIGLSNSDRLLEDIPNKIQTHLGIVCGVNQQEDGELSFIEIDVKPYDVPISYHGTFYYRSGSTKQELTGNGLTEFLLKKSGKTWGDVVEPKGKLSDIDPAAIEAFKRGARLSKRMTFTEEDTTESILDNLLLLDDGQLKRAAVLLFGKNPGRFFINAYVKIGRFGATDDDLRFQEVVEGNAFQLVDFTLDILDKKFLISAISYQGLHRVEQWEYPYEAIREVILNAVAHRDYMGAPIQISVYDDHISIWNEGKLPPELTIDDLKKKHSSRPRNQIVANAFFRGGLIEAWGRGTVNVINECRKMGLPEPTFEESSGGFLFTVYKKEQEQVSNSQQKPLNERQKKAIEYVKEHGRITNKKYQEINKISRRTATDDLMLLVEFDFLQASGIKGAGAYYFLK